MTLCTRISQAEGKWGVWTKPLTGDPMAPFDDPVANWPAVRFHSDLQYLNNSLRIDGISINHALVAGLTGTGYAAPASTQTPSGPIGSGQVVTIDHVLYTHGLGYVPRYQVLFGGRIVAPHTVVQALSSPRRVRYVSVYATTTIIGLREVGVSATTDLPAISVSYDLLLFRRPEKIAGAPLLRLKPDAGSPIQMGYGRITSDHRPLRRVASIADASFYVPLGRTCDIRNGAVRVSAPDGAVDEGTYTGGFFAASYIAVTT